MNKNPEHSRMSLKRDHHPTIIFEGQLHPILSGQFIRNSNFIWATLNMGLGTFYFKSYKHPQVRPANWRNHNNCPSLASRSAPGINPRLAFLLLFSFFYLSNSNKTMKWHGMLIDWFMTGSWINGLLKHPEIYIGSIYVIPLQAASIIRVWKLVTAHLDDDFFIQRLPHVGL